MIVAHHYVVNSGLMSCIDAQNVLHFQDYFLLLFGWGGKTGINCFVLITGYFIQRRNSLSCWEKGTFTRWQSGVFSFLPAMKHFLSRDS